MQMFVTAYYDFSSIGQTRFPGSLILPDTEVLNKKLRATRGTFTSTTSGVRRANIESRGPKGILAEIRKGIRGLNNLANVAGDYVQTAGQVMGGRIVRLPVGAAGYLASLGTPALGSGALSTGDAAAGEALQTDLSNRIAAFQQFVAAAGSVKLRVPTYAEFAPSWTSKVDPGSFRGFFWENIDEYPERSKPQKLVELIHDRTEDAYLEALDKGATRRLASAQYQAQIEAKLEELSADGGTLQDIAERVQFAKSNFGMVMNAKALVTDPVGVGRSVVGLPATDESLAESLAKRGILISAGSISNFVGRKALQTFQQVAESWETQGDQAGVALLGEAYSQNAYQPVSDALDTTYESAYGDDDYTGLVSTVPDSVNSLEEAYGDKDAPEISEVEPSTLDEVYPGTTEPTTPSNEEQAISGNLTNVPVPNAEDVEGIRGVGDADAGIDPVV